jgi:predicted site-specific integrase-resolvase
VKTYSTQQAAKKAGIHWVTLHRWLAARKIRPAIAVPMDGGRTLWRWTEKDIVKLGKVKEATYRKGRGRKPKGRKKKLR